MGDSTPPVNHPLSSRGLFVPLDVNYADDPKVIEAGAEAELVYVRSLALAKRLASDGRIHRAHLWRLASDLPSVRSGLMAVTDFPEHLMASGLWDEDFDGWVIVAWDRWNLTAAEVEERKRGKARGAAVANHKRWHEARGVVDPDCPLCSGRSSDDERIAIATDSESTKTETEGETKRASDAIARGSRIPIPYVVSPADQEWAEREHPAVDWDEETKKFVDHFRAKTGKDATKLDWSATWRNWIRRAHGGWR